MKVEQVVPILNVGDVTERQAWFGKLGWERGFEWRGSHDGPVDFGEPWNMREMHVRHPDGHVLRISRAS